MDRYVAEPGAKSRTARATDLTVTALPFDGDPDAIFVPGDAGLKFKSRRHFRGKVLDAGTDNSAPYFAIELVRGTTAHRVM